MGRKYLLERKWKAPHKRGKGEINKKESPRVQEIVRWPKKRKEMTRGMYLPSRGGKQNATPSQGKKEKSASWPHEFRLGGMQA